jgi:hypothetical protein
MSELVNKYNEFISFLKENSNIERQKDLIVYEKLDQSKIEGIVSEYVRMIDENKKYQSHLLNENKKLFALNRDIQLVNFGLKSVYKKFSDEKKSSFWEFLQILYILGNKNNDNMEFNIKLLNKLEKTTSKDSDGDDDDLELNLADKMIRDIAESFDNANGVNSKEGAINNILETSQKIGEKYRKDMESGKLNFGDMLNSFQKLAETFDEEDDDEEGLDSTMLPTPDELLEKLVPGGFEGEQMKSMFKNMESMLSGSGKGGASNPFAMMGNLFGMKNNEKKEAVGLTDEQLEELEKYYKEKGIDLDELNKGD